MEYSCVPKLFRRIAYCAVNSGFLLVSEYGSPNCFRKMLVQQWQPIYVGLFYARSFTEVGGLRRASTSWCKLVLLHLNSFCWGRRRTSLSFSLKSLWVLWSTITVANGRLSFRNCLWAWRFSNVFSSIVSCANDLGFVLDVRLRCGRCLDK